MSAPVSSEAAEKAVHYAEEALRYEALPMPQAIVTLAGSHVRSILSNSNVKEAVENHGYKIGNGIGIEHTTLIMLEDKKTGEYLIEVRNPNRYHDKASDRIVQDVPILRIRKDGIFVVEQGGKENKIDSKDLPLPDYLRL